MVNEISKLPELFPGFESVSFVTDNMEIFARIGGNGSPLVLLHGFPQSNVMWHAIANELIKHYTLIIPDLPGYGASLPLSDKITRTQYSKQAMAGEILTVVSGLGFSTFMLAGHGLGGRVACRLALDHPCVVESLVILDTVPDIVMWQAVTERLALKVLHWLLLSQPPPLPEQMISNNPNFFVETVLSSWTKTGDLSPFDPHALTHYRLICSSKQRLRAICAGYRASATIDSDRDRSDLDRQRKIECPTLLIWGNHGMLGLFDNPFGIWSSWCDDLRGMIINCGHFICEEQPDATLGGFVPFLAFHR